ncbi:MAG: Rrf2 family transcriptional regulator [Gemmatimonadaceae bacterium]|nr:Rrf2 family transcriptional regulator [Gemmatimonadaceae bacterium]
MLLAIARDHDVRLREIAVQVGITERAVQKIISELENAGALSKSRDGRRNHYEVNTDVALRHPMESHRTVDALVRMVHDRDPLAQIGVSQIGVRVTENLVR